MGKAHTWRAGLLLRDHVDVSVDGCDFASGLVRFYAIMYVVFVLRVLRLPITVVMLQPW
jgi:hypothetical protein